MSAWIFYATAIGFATGVYVRSVWELGWVIPIVLSVVGGVLVGVLRVTARERHPRLIVLSILCITGALGIMRVEVATWGRSDVQFEERLNQNVVLEGVIVEEVDERANTAQLTVHVDSIDKKHVDRRVLVISDRFPTFAYGDRVRVEATLTLPEAFETTLGRMFDYPGYLSARGIRYIATRAHVRMLNEGNGYVVVASLLAVKHAFMHQVEILLPEPQAGLAEGLVLGVKRALGADLEQAFRVAGVIHIIVLSGYNVTIVVEAVMRLLAFLRPRMRAICGGLAIVAFALIAGFSATVVRASLMAVFVLIARVSGRQYHIARALVFTGLCMIVMNPALLVFDPGFQLSFLATLGLVVVAPLLETRLWRVPTRFHIREVMTSTIATQVLVLPLLLYSTGLFSVMALFVNMLILPIVPLTMLCIFIAGMLGFLGQLVALPLAFLAYALLNYIISVVLYAEALPFASVNVPLFPFWLVGLCYAVLTIVLWRVYRKIQKGVPAPKEPERLVAGH